MSRVNKNIMLLYYCELCVFHSELRYANNIQALSTFNLILFEFIFKAFTTQPNH